MNVTWTKFNTSYAGQELASSLRSMRFEVLEFVKKYYERKDDRILVIVFLCPCCVFEPKMELENAVFVSPFLGISSSGTHKVTLDPRFTSTKDFFKHFEEVIEEALRR